MYKFEESFLVKINEIWTPVKGETIDWRLGSLICKHNGYPYYFADNCQCIRFDVGTSEEALKQYAIEYNINDMNHKIACEKKQAQSTKRRRLPQGLQDLLDASTWRANPLTT